MVGPPKILLQSVDLHSEEVAIHLVSSIHLINGYLQRPIEETRNPSHQLISTPSDSLVWTLLSSILRELSSTHLHQELCPPVVSTAQLALRSSQLRHQAELHAYARPAPAVDRRWPRPPDGGNRWRSNKAENPGKISTIIRPSRGNLVPGPWFLGKIPKGSKVWANLREPSSAPAIRLRSFVLIHLHSVH